MGHDSASHCPLGLRVAGDGLQLGLRWKDRFLGKARVTGRGSGYGPALKLRLVHRTQFGLGLGLGSGFRLGLGLGLVLHFGHLTRNELFAIQTGSPQSGS